MFAKRVSFLICNSEQRTVAETINIYKELGTC